MMQFHRHQVHVDLFVWCQSRLLTGKLLPSLENCCHEIIHSKTNSEQQHIHTTNLRAILTIVGTATVQEFDLAKAKSGNTYEGSGRLFRMSEVPL